jgi:antitoxin Phd
MAKTMQITEVRADFSKVADEVARTGMPVTVLSNDIPFVVITPAAHDAVDVAVDFMDEYASVFEELAK